MSFNRLWIGSTMKGFLRTNNLQRVRTLFQSSGTDPSGQQLFSSRSLGIGKPCPEIDLVQCVPDTAQKLRRGNTSMPGFSRS
ncbi:hypothetical protein A0H81_11568 [Grifola frondosa]|uniref:Uncharacterized protein n=1 Tax=Grifola frondosa TaxID=5627 RepID=A0A1C7LUW1_GRIFR|nr:hypothetical protein A0H81_11568 [Grifola frondosa]